MEGDGCKFWKFCISIYISSRPFFTILQLTPSALHMLPIQLNLKHHRQEAAQSGFILVQSEWIILLRLVDLYSCNNSITTYLADMDHKKSTGKLILAKWRSHFWNPSCLLMYTQTKTGKLWLQQQFTQYINSIGLCTNLGYWLGKGVAFILPYFLDVIKRCS